MPDKARSVFDSCQIGLHPAIRECRLGWRRVKELGGYDRFFICRPRFRNESYKFLVLSFFKCEISSQVKEKLAEASDLHIIVRVKRYVLIFQWPNYVAALHPSQVQRNFVSHSLASYHLQNLWNEIFERSHVMIFPMTKLICGRCIFAKCKTELW